LGLLINPWGQCECGVRLLYFCVYDILFPTMARKPRLYFPGALYHVMLRGNSMQKIYHSKEDKIHFEKLIEEGIKRFGHRIHAYCWMNNHVHLAIQVANIPLSKIIQNLSFRYTRWINRKNNLTGHLFQGRYKAILIDAENYLLELVRYIHLNPVIAKLVSRPEEYEWSGHRVYLGISTCPWLTIEWVLSQDGGDWKSASKRYESFVLDGLDEGYRREFHSGRTEGRILGDDRFMEETLDRVGKGLERKVSLSRIIEVVCKEFKVGTDQLISRDRSWRLSRIRTLIAYLLLEYGKGNLSDFARYINRDISTISNALRVFKLRLQKDKATTKKIMEFQRVLKIGKI